MDFYATRNANYRKRSFLWLIIAFLIVSCATENTIRPGDSLTEAFTKAKNFYENKEYSEASSAFETVISIGRGTDVGQRAQFLLAESYFKNSEYLMAASEYNRYANLYPQDTLRQEVDFKRALCFYHLSPTYKLSQKHTHKAIDLFELFISRYPDSDKVKQASKYIDQLRAKLARKLYESAQLYMRTDEYEAASIYYGLAAENYPETKWAENALAKQIHAYVKFARHSISSKQVERYRKAIDSYEEYIQLFPKGAHRSEAEKYYDMATSELEEIKGKDEVLSKNQSSGT